MTAPIIYLDVWRAIKRDRDARAPQPSLAEHIGEEAERLELEAMSAAWGFTDGPEAA